MAKFIGYVVLVAMAIILRAYTVQMNWEWFITPFGVMSLTMFHALGLSGIVALLTHQMPSKKTETEDFEETISYSLCLSIMFSLITLWNGWLFHLFMDYSAK